MARRDGRPSPSWTPARVRGALRRRWDVLLVIAAGGAVGALARWGLGELVPHPSGAFPWSTFLANITGAFVLGALMALVLDVWPTRRYVRPFWGVGVLGGYTTFSTYMNDTRVLLAAGHAPVAAAYLLGTLAAGLPAAYAGLVAARAAVAASRRRRGRLEADPSA